MALSKGQNLLNKVKLAISVLRYPGQVTKSEIETIEKDLAEIVKETKGKESKPLPVTSLKKKDVETLFGTKHSKTMDVSWADVSTSDFEKPKLLGKMSHPLMISVSDRGSRRGAGNLWEGPQELDKQRRSYPGAIEYNPHVHPGRRQLDPAPPREGYVLPTGDICQDRRF